MLITRLLSIMMIIGIISIHMNSSGAHNIEGSQYSYETLELYRTNNIIQSQYEGAQERFSTVTEGNTIHILWVETINGNPGFTLQYSSFNESVVQTQTLDVQGFFIYWKLVIESDYLYGYYSSFSQLDNNTCDLFFIKSPINQLNWTVQKIYSYNQTTILTSPSLTCADENIFLFWTIGSNILSISSSDRGETWSNASVVHTTPNFCRTVVSGILNNKLHVIWDDGRNISNDANELYCISSTDNGQTWSNETRLIELSRYTSDYMGLIPLFEIDSDHCYLLFTDTFGNVMYLMNSNDNGITWDVQSDVFCDTFTGNYQFSWALHEEKIVIIRPISGSWTLIQSNDFGDTWTNLTLEGDYEDPAVEVINGYPCIIDVKYDTTTNENVLYGALFLDKENAPLISIELISIIAVIVIALATIPFMIKGNRRTNEK